MTRETNGANPAAPRAGDRALNVGGSSEANAAGDREPSVSHHGPANLAGDTDAIVARSNDANVEGDVARLRFAGIIEGISWLVLLFIAMPLKYGLGQPGAVRVVGAIHGGLFIAFVALLAWAHFRRGWSVLRSAALFLSALLPFGFLFVDRNLQAELRSIRGD